MKVYINPKSIGTSNFEYLKNQFPNVVYIVNEEEAYLAEVVVIMPDFFKHHDINQFKSLKWVQLLMAGYDNFDFSIFAGKDVVVSNAVDVFSVSIAEDVITKILVINRNVKHYVNDMYLGKWNPIRKEPELTGSTVGIVGAGSIGIEVAKRLKSFDTKVIGYKRKAEAVRFFDEIYTGNEGLEKVIRESDYLIIAVPLTKETMHLINKERISWMKPNSVIINVARGKIVDQDALVDALNAGKIRGAGLDVTTPEPLPKEHPLWKMSQVFITPHNASSSPFMQRRLMELVLHNLERYVNNNTVDYIIF
ncbi:MAG: D-2-hydroxyacid dehydrogenase [Bacilli bacterium]|nr:D-2-hydroxyacid dehydrogenase [Bacilli bacterium]